MKIQYTQDKAIQFIGRFLSWYQDSYSLPDVVNRVKLEELVKEAESIHTEKVKELYVELDKKYKEKTLTNKKRIKSRTKYGSVRKVL